MRPGWILLYFILLIYIIFVKRLKRGTIRKVSDAFIIVRHHDQSRKRGLTRVGMEGQLLLERLSRSEPY